MAARPWLRIPSTVPVMARVFPPTKILDALGPPQPGRVASRLAWCWANATRWIKLGGSAVVKATGAPSAEAAARGGQATRAKPEFPPNNPLGDALRINAGGVRAPFVQFFSFR